MVNKCIPIFILLICLFGCNGEQELVEDLGQDVGQDLGQDVGQDVEDKFDLSDKIANFVNFIKTIKNDYVTIKISDPEPEPKNIALNYHFVVTIARIFNIKFSYGSFDDKEENIEEKVSYFSLQQHLSSLKQYYADTMPFIFTSLITVDLANKIWSIAIFGILIIALVFLFCLSFYKYLKL